MTRRQFAIWFGFGLFNLSERLHADGLDRLAAATMRAAGPPTKGAAAGTKSAAVHWTVGGDDIWRWYERENLIDGQWVQTGITTPINKKTGARKWEPGGYLDISLMPRDMRAADDRLHASLVNDLRTGGTEEGPSSQLPTKKRRGRHGRPPSKWLRSLHAYELRTWLKTIEVPEAGVEGMTYWEHLTRDHLFDADKILGLTESEQALLHAAAHFGD
jgi:hypothetical protein